MKSIKTLLQDMHLTHGVTVVCEIKANSAGTTSCTLHIMTLGLSGKREVSLEAETLSADKSPLPPPDPLSDKESPPLSGPTILHLFHDLSSNSEPEDSDYNESYSYGYSVLAVPKTVSVPYKLCSGKTTTTAHPSLTDAKAMVACPYLAQDGNSNHVEIKNFNTFNVNSGHVDTFNVDTFNVNTIVK
ncbi:hypothetical protein DSO57_1008545 [Entomophthora muscae]|uniref:Uncharacterized protein n=1 Tax=Entomophthora muscae TaxID=34485 RepID=A0ACC2USX4_9FUNG|nr:hypothetical protein DSO57_1008545 [Entomophthora muscae]